MNYNFDEVISRKGTRSFKWEFVKEHGKVVTWDRTDDKYGDERVLPMWVADMDFPSPKPVVDALVERAQHGMYGYTYPDASLYDSAVSWMDRRHEWPIQADWIRFMPVAIIPAIHMMMQTFIQPGDKVLIQQPVYYPFNYAITNNGGEIVSNSLVYENGRYHMNYEDLEEKTADPAVKAAILSNPHNPVGRVWSADELKKFAEICIRNQVVMIADEIHGDLTFKGIKFTPLASLSDTIAEHVIVCTGPSKTFNLAGLHTSNIIIPGESLRTQIDGMMRREGLFGLNAFGATALEAAYNHGEEWLEQMMDYVQDNYTCMASFFSSHLPQLPIIQPEATYLVWFDCRSLGLDSRELEHLMFDQAHLYLDEGYIFGPEGEGFERINIACPRSILEEALGRIKTVVERL